MIYPISNELELSVLEVNPNKKLKIYMNYLRF